MRYYLKVVETKKHFCQNFSVPETGDCEGAPKIKVPETGNSDGGIDPNIVAQAL
jgi:hypothetical protein